MPSAGETDAQRKGELPVRNLGENVHGQKTATSFVCRHGASGACC